MNSNFFLFFLLVLFGLHTQAQVISLGVKWEEKIMGEASLNYPIFWKNDSKFDMMLGVNYTTSNKNSPSGLQPQITGIYRLIDAPTKDYFLGFQMTTGYLIEFNKEFENQWRISPHFYWEYLGFLNLKVGYEYLTPLDKGYLFVSIGLGGIYMFKDFRMM